VTKEHGELTGEAVGMPGSSPRRLPKPASPVELPIHPAGILVLIPRAPRQPPESGSLARDHRVVPRIPTTILDYPE
jgi:hypothetical protein